MPVAMAGAVIAGAEPRARSASTPARWQLSGPACATSGARNWRDTSTTAGKAMFQMLGVFAEFERGIIRERVNAGLARARAKGTKLGRRTVKPSVEARIRELKAGGMGILKIGRTVGVGTSVVQRVVAAGAS
jgi:DNA invertase Pin-like site-specific DNA recombinase